MHGHVVEKQEKHEQVFELLFLDCTKMNIIYSNKTVRFDITVTVIIWIDVSVCK